MRRLALVALLAFAPGDARADLGAKAEAFERAIAARHLSPEGLLLYRIDLARIEADLASGRYPENADSPTFNGLYAAGACARAESLAGEARTQAVARADRALAGFELLMRVTGVPGLLARTMRRAPPSRGATGRWFEGAAGFEGWHWRGDVSLDQYANGLVPAVGLCRGLFPERTRALVVGVAEHLLAHDFRLTDPDGRTTRFGDLRPGAQLGLNGIAQLTTYAVFALAQTLDPDPRWALERGRLRDRARVLARGRRTNVRVFGITNHSNDLMAWNLLRVLVPLARAQRDPGVADLRHAASRVWLRTRDYGNAYGDLVYCALEPRDCAPEVLARARATLEAFPLEKRKVAPDPSLADAKRRLVPGRKWTSLARDVVPIAKRAPSSFEWKSSPYRLERDVHPDTEYTGLDYLLAYWLYEEICARRDCPS